jgi:23S rRNA (uracil1939-C5)-methyltransferase
LARRKNYPRYDNVEVVDIADKGKAIARVNEQVVIIDHAVPGDIVDIQVIRKRKNYLEARLVNIQRFSEHREKPFCEHFDLCGGCKWQDMKYCRQLYHKQQQVENQLKRIGHLDLPSISEILPSKETDYYRNKLEYTFSNFRWIEDSEPKIERTEKELYALGFHIPGRFDKVLNLKNCYLQASPSNDIRNFVRDKSIELNLNYYDIKKHTGYLRNLTIRTAQTGEVMVLLSIAGELNSDCKKLLDSLNKNFNITSLMYVVNTKLNDSINDLIPVLYSGKDFIIENLNGLKFKIGPKSFFQTNSKQAEILYKVVKDFASPNANDVIYDLYTGTGTIANYLALECKQVIGIEYINEAISDAKFNAELNEITNSLFFAGDIKDVLNESFVIEYGKPSIIVLDPPRAGIHEDVANQILKIAPQKIVYVSCNAATQARDLAILTSNYNITKVQPVDMFPHTQHVENVVKLDRK